MGTRLRTLAAWTSAALLVAFVLASRTLYGRRTVDVRLDLEREGAIFPLARRASGE